MRRLMILNLFVIGTIFSAFAQKTIATYDVNEDKQTTVILRDSAKSDQDILNELDLDDYTVGEEVYITAEMWAEIQAEKEKKNKRNINESSKVQEKAVETIAIEEETLVQEKITETPTRARRGATPGISATKKKKKKKVRKYRMKKPKRRKNSTKRGKIACYSF